MKTFKFLFPLVAVGALTVAGCGDDTTTGDSAATDSGQIGHDADADADADADTDTDADADADTDTDTGIPDDPYAFSTSPPSDYTRVDRAGMPAINTAVIASKDAYNAADPTHDAAGDFVGEIIASLDFLHAALDDDLTSLGLTPCTVAGDGTGSCVAAAAPLVLPDTLKIDATADGGFPNGRDLDDPVMDVTLAVVLLELADGTHAADTLVGVLNPTSNDVPNSPSFPYVAAAQ